MKNRFGNLLLLLGAGALLAHPAWGDELSLDDAIDYAMANSPVLQGSAASVSASSEQVKTAEAGRLPRIDLGYGAVYSDNPLLSLGSKLNARSVTAEDFNPDRLNNPGTTDSYAASLALQLPIYTGGKLTAVIDEANALNLSAAQQHARTRTTIAYQVNRAYLLAQAALKAVEIARKGATAANQHVRTTSKLLEEGRIVPSDKLTAEVYHTSVRSTVEQAKTQYTQALNALKQAMGMDLSADISVAPWAQDGIAAGIPTLSDAETLALANRHDLKATDAGIDAAEARTRQAQSLSKPELAVEARSSLYAEDPLVDELSWGVMALARINLYSGGANKSRVSAAREEKNRLLAEKLAQQLEIRKEVRNAYAAIEEGTSRVNLASKNLKTAQQAVKLVNQRYGEGRTILIDLLQSEQALLQSRGESMNARLLRDASILDLRHAMDRLLEDSGDES